MAEEVTPKKLVTVGVWQGGGPAPGYEWTVLILQYAFEEAMFFLDDGQYEYVSMQVKDLAGHRDPTHSDTLSLDKVGTFYELRMKGGGVGKGLNARVYFDLADDPPNRAIRILGFDLKKNEDQILTVVRDRILRRQKRWNEGLYPMIGQEGERGERKGRT